MIQNIQDHTYNIYKYTYQVLLTFIFTVVVLNSINVMVKINTLGITKFYTSTIVNCEK